MNTKVKSPYKSGAKTLPARNAKNDIPKDLYKGIIGTDPESIEQARRDREQGLLTELRHAKTALLQKGKRIEATRISRRILRLKKVFDNTI